ncbi:MAG TPA: DNA recombination protein RmuC [Desulfobulbus sp.]|nr:DNA recombination protein RmuC [Desulfobulbus sp.]
MHSLSQLIARLQPESLALGAITALAVAVVAGLLLAGRLQRRRLLLSLRLEQMTRNQRRLEDENNRLRDHCQSLEDQCRRLAGRNAGLEEALALAKQQAREQMEFFRQSRRQLEQDFRLLAQEVLSEKGERLAAEHEAGIRGLLEPVREQLRDFRKKVEDVYDRESRDRVAMIREIEHLKRLNERISADAIRLTDALRGSSKVQGQWGEMLLEKLLEDSGLRRGSEFDTQVAMQNGDGERQQPDVIVHLPGGREIIIDAKVSLTAYVRAHQATDRKQQEQLLARHVESVKKHVAGLSAKRYQDLLDLGNLDFVLLFIPVEGAFQAALGRRPEMLQEAMRKKVILCSPSSLLAILRTIHHLWRLDEQNRNSLAIAKQAGNLYDKFVGFAEAFEEIGLRLDQTRKSWQTAKKRLVTGRGNLVSRARALRELGVEPGRELPDSLTGRDST